MLPDVKIRHCCQVWETDIIVRCGNQALFSDVCENQTILSDIVVSDTVVRCGNQALL